MLALYQSFSDFLHYGPLEAQKVGWPRVVADRIYKRVGLDFRGNAKEVRRRVSGSTRRVYCRVESSDEFEFQHWFGSNRAALDLPLRPRTIIDAGANVGYSVTRFRAEFPDAFIIALEPEESNLVQFKKNCGRDRKVALEEKALWHTSVPLRIKSGKYHFNCFQVEEARDGDVQAVSIADLLSKYNWPVVDLLKVDVEGAEKDIFAHPNAALWLPRVKMILIELHDFFDPTITPTVERALSGKFDFVGMRGELALYLNRQQ